MKRKALQVTIDVQEPSVVELSVGDKVQLDRLAPSNHGYGYVAERHGRLLDAGVAKLALEPGFYFFKTLSDAHLKVIRGGVNTSAAPNDKQGGPIELELPLKGDEAPGEAPRFTVE